MEVEAYIGEDDRASHARFGRTARNAVMFGPPGLAYVYLVYGMYDCLNVVTEPEGRPAAVLVRAVEPVDGIDLMRSARLAWLRSRGRGPGGVEKVPGHRLAGGPGLVCAAFSIDRTQTGTDLCDPAAGLHLEQAPVGSVGGPPRDTVVAGPRIGVAYAGEEWAARPWRFRVAGNPSVSR